MTAADIAFGLTGRMIEALGTGHTRMTSAGVVGNKNTIKALQSRGLIGLDFRWTKLGREVAILVLSDHVPTLDELHEEASRYDRLRRFDGSRYFYGGQNNACSPGCRAHRGITGNLRHLIGCPQDKLLPQIHEEAIRENESRSGKKTPVPDRSKDRPAWARGLDLSGDSATDDGLSHMYSSYRSVLRRLANTEVELAHARAEVIRLKAAPLLAARRFRRDEMIGQCDAVEKQTAQRIIVEHARAPRNLIEA